MENDDNNKNEKDNESSSSVEYFKNEIPQDNNDVNKSLIIRQLYDHTTRKFSTVVIGNKKDRHVLESEESLCIDDGEYTSLNSVSSSNQSIKPPPTNTKTGKSTKAALTQSYASLKGSNSTTSSTSSKNPQSNFCNNCGRIGHIFQQCKQPITSIGIIAFRYNKKKEVNAKGCIEPSPSLFGEEKEEIQDKFEYLMINRTHSLGYVEFMRGKYPVYNFDYLINIFNEMTLEEKSKIQNSSFNQLWKDLWGEFIGQQYRNEEKTSREKFNILKIGVDLGISRDKYSLDKLISKSNQHVQWKDTEWGFPKGRRNFQEKDLACAYREFEEETGYDKRHLHLIQNVMPFEEIFTGSNMKSYKHKYFLAYMEPESGSCSFPSEYHSSEVGEMKWLSYNECVANMRPYNIEKIDILKKINKLLYNFSIHYAIQ